jgi:predicted transcriptional regulator of viral defense system
MKHYKKLVDMRCFTSADVEAITGNQDTARSVLYSYQKRGLIQSVRRGLYVAISFETEMPVPNRYIIGAKVADGAYISHHSAFEVYGVANQVYYEVYVTSEKRFTPCEFEGIRYRRVAQVVSSGVFTNRNGIRMTDTERTVIDSINYLEKIGGLEETLNCIGSLPRLNDNKLLEYLSEYGKGFLYQRTGYLLSQIPRFSKLPGSFYAECQSKIPKANRYLYNGLQKEPHKLDRDWNLYVPETLCQGDAAYYDF